MLDYALKSILRQRTRSFLTILGILIGIAAIVALGSIAEGINASVQNSLELSAGKIMVTETGGGMFGMTGSLTDEDVSTISDLSGVQKAVPVLMYYQMNFGAPEYFVIGINMDDVAFFVGENTQMEEGRMIDEGESEVAIIGKTTAEKYSLEPGDYFKVKDTEFEIVGVMESTGINDIDQSIVVPVHDLQIVLDRDDYQVIYVIPDDVKDTERISDDITDLDERYNTMSSQEIARQAGQIVDQIRAFTFGIGAIAAFVGGLGVMNTMIMAVMERRKEIGVMKAIGATNNMILKQILTESALISLIGGAGGILLGVIGALGIGLMMPGQLGGAIVTPGLALTGLAFALFLGIAGGFYPARKAAKLDPVEALRYE